MERAMCLLVFIASEYELPTLSWDQEQPRFHVTELTERDEPVRSKFSKPHVYYAGSHEGCGCGFQYGEYDGFEEEANLLDMQNSRRRLAEYLVVALQHQSAVELFACWDGDQAAEPDHRSRIRPADLLKGRTFFQEREFLVVAE
jgi:hypothetical protein